MASGIGGTKHMVLKDIQSIEFPENPQLSFPIIVSKEGSVGL